MKIRGQVKKKLMYKGTKSEHEGFVIVSDQGRFKLRRRGGNPFRDEKLAELEGKEIECEGILRSGQFIMDRWEVLT
jgi:hypothetical protein